MSLTNGIFSLPQDNNSKKNMTINKKAIEKYEQIINPNLNKKLFQLFWERQIIDKFDIYHKTVSGSCKADEYYSIHFFKNKKNSNKKLVVTALSIKQNKLIQCLFRAEENQICEMVSKYANMSIINKNSQPFFTINTCAAKSSFDEKISRKQMLSSFRQDNNIFVSSIYKNKKEFINNEFNYKIPFACPKHNVELFPGVPFGQKKVESDEGTFKPVVMNVTKT